jgi:hypothetical protein
MRENKSLKPLFPSTILVITIPAMLGPSSMTGNIIRPANLGTGKPRSSLGAMTASAPNHEMANVSAK